MFEKLSFRSAVGRTLSRSSEASAVSRLLYIFAVAVTAVGVYGFMTVPFANEAMPTVNAQSDMYLSQRIDRLEQRFNYLDSRIAQIQSESRTASIMPRPVPNSAEQEIQFLRTQIDGLRARLGELECGLLHVDERTLTAAQRSARRRTAQGSSEKCRANWSTPIELSARP